METHEKMMADVEAAEGLLADAESQSGFGLGGPLADCSSHVRELLAEVGRLKRERVATIAMIARKVQARHKDVEWAEPKEYRVALAGLRAASEILDCARSAAGLDPAGAGRGGEK